VVLSPVAARTQSIWTGYVSDRFKTNYMQGIIRLVADRI
jgi:hypothetical protein